MSKHKEKLLKKAQEVYKKVLPCGGRKSFSECFTVYENELVLWFNTKDGSTHIVRKEIPDN